MKSQKENNTHCQKRAASLKAKVCRELRWTDLQYNEYQLDKGHDYLMAYLKGDEYSVSVMERSAIFWKWWRNHWANRDEGFMEFVTNTTYSVADMREFYGDVNEAALLAECIYPNGVILSESYATMIKELVYEEVKK
jgi:hypothetical protein